MNTDWHFIDDLNLDIDSTPIKFSDVLTSLLSAHIPTRTYILRPNDAPWMNGQIRRQQRKRDRLHKKAKSIDSETAWTDYRKQRNYVTSLIKAAKRSQAEWIAIQINSLGSSNSDWWKLVKSCFGSTHDYPRPRERHTTMTTPLRQMHLTIFSPR